jgi:hypothetical protein
MGGELRSLPNDDVIVRIGGEPPREFLTRIGVQLVHKEIGIGASARTPGAD